MAALPAEPFAFHNVHQRSLLRWQGLFAAVSTAAGCPVRVLEPWGGERSCVFPVAILVNFFNYVLILRAYLVPAAGLEPFVLAE